MLKELELWQFVASHLKNGEPVVLLVVAKSSGSSPGRAGYKMAVAANGDMCGSIGGGVMEVSLAELAKRKTQKVKDEIETEIIEQVHQKNSPESSGMICSGKQTIIVRRLYLDDLVTVESIVDNLYKEKKKAFKISNLKFEIVEYNYDKPTHFFSKMSETEFAYQEKLGSENILYIIGGGHCALALSEMMSKFDFRISIFDDRPDLNTIAKNEFADDITIIDNYNQIGVHIPNGDNIYVVVMTLGYKFDEIVIRSLFDYRFKYFGVLGSRAKMKTLITELEKEGFNKETLSQIRTPIGIPINSHTPEEIAVSIAAEIIAVKNKRG